MRLQARVVRRALRSPAAAAHGESDARRLLLVSLHGDDGAVGYGEAAPLPSYDGVTVEQVLSALEACREPLAAWTGAAGARAEVLAACRESAVLPQAVAGVDLAMWDLLGRSAGAPVWRLLGASRAPAVEVNATIAAADRAGAAREASAARAAGFSILKLKVGLGDDAGRLAAVRAAIGPQVAIRLDANGAWTIEEAAGQLRALAPAGIELCEEPVHGLEAIGSLRERLRDGGIDVALALDESAALPGALDARHAQAVCLKISRGGISGVIDDAALARAAGYEVYLASTLDGPLGIAAALHACAVIAPDRACGLATLGLFGATRRTDPARTLSTAAGRMRVPAGPGLDEHSLRFYALAADGV